jgi:hypothetical protein
MVAAAKAGETHGEARLTLDDLSCWRAPVTIRELVDQGDRSTGQTATVQGSRNRAGRVGGCVNHLVPLPRLNSAHHCGERIDDGAIRIPGRVQGVPGIRYGREADGINRDQRRPIILVAERVGASELRDCPVRRHFCRGAPLVPAAADGRPCRIEGRHGGRLDCCRFLSRLDPRVQGTARVVVARDGRRLPSVLDQGSNLSLDQGAECVPSGSGVRRLWI